MRHSRRMLGLSMVGVVLTLVMLALQVAAHLRFRADRNVALSSAELERRLEHVDRLLVDAESGRRGFLLTGKESYLDPYRRAQHEVPLVLEALHAALRDDPAQQARLAGLDGLASAKLDELRETVALEEAGSHEQAAAIVRSERGKRIMDRIRGVVADAESAEGARIGRYYARAERQSRLGLVASAAAAGGTLAAGMLLLAASAHLRRRQELRIVDLQNFAGRVAHDIRSPLATVSLGIDAAKRHFEEKDRALAALDRAGKPLQRVSTLVEGLLGFARAGQRPEQGAEADVGAVVREVVASTRDAVRERGAAVEVEVEGEMPATKVACAPGVLTSMVGNLVDNAVKYIGEGPTKRVTVRATSHRGSTRVEVRDTGPGVPREVWGTLFEPYLRAVGSKAQGLGLGLATVRRLAEAHGGSVGLSKNVPWGSVFWFELPNVAEPSEGRFAWWARAWRTRMGAAHHG